MTQLIGGIGIWTGISEDDDRLKPQYATFRHQSVIIRDACKDPVGYSPFTGSWWPGAGMHGLLGDAGDINTQSGIWHDLPEVTRGHNGVYYIRGYARDAIGNTLSGATLKLYHTTDDTVQSTYVSASDGSYTLNTGFTDSHYIVAYKAGPPDIEGTTINTLVPGV